MFKKILIANRGEIALRVIFACRELGIKTVAVYSEADENSLHVRFADEDICIGAGAQRRQLPERAGDHQRRRDHRRRRHPPGYGFLSESAYLAEVCEACHIRFIGPDPQVIRLIGDKARARRVDEEGRPADAAGQRRPGRERRAGAASWPRRSAIRSSSRRSPAAAAAACASSGRRANWRTRCDRAARGRGGVRQRRRLHREVPRVAAPHRVPDPRRPPRQRRPPRRARVLDPAPPPEAARGVAVAGAHRQGAPQDGRARRRRRQGGAVHERRHVRVPDGRQGPLLLHGSEHPRCRSSTRSPRW